MPYPKEHTARQLAPDKFKTFRRENDKFGPGIDAIWGMSSEGKTELQSVRFNADKYSPAQAKEWLTKHKLQSVLEAAVEASLNLTYKSTGALALSNEQTKEGVTSQRFRKELIKTGKYRKDSTGQSFEITLDLLKHWEIVFSQMAQNGIKVSMPKTHQAFGDPINNLGWVENIFVDGESLVGVVELIGKDALELARKSDVSIWVPPEFVDGKGNKYSRPIVHVALCTDPVIPGLSGFEPIAASLLCTYEKESDMDLNKIKQALGIAEDLTADNAESLILSSVDGMKQSLANLTAEFDQLKQAHSALKLSQETKAVDPMLLSVVKDNRSMKLDGLVTAGVITPATKKGLEKLYMEDESLTLSLSKGGDHFDALVKILVENKPVPLGETSGRQTLGLSQSGEKNLLMADIEKRKKAAGTH